MSKDVDGVVVIGTELDTTGFNKGLKEMQGETEIIEKTAKSTSVFQKIFAKMGRFGTGFLKTVGQIGSKVLKLAGLFGTVALAVTAIIGILAILGSAISRAMQDEEIKANLEYIKFALGKAIEPLVDAIAKIIAKIITWVYKLLGLINALSISLFGVDLFASATVEDFKNASKEAKNLKKQLAGFDEMNVLNDNGTTGAIGGISDDIPDLGEQTQKAMGWLDKLKGKVQEIKENLEKTGDWRLFSTGFENTKKGFIELTDGLVETAKGTGQVIRGILTGDEEQVQKGFNNLGEGLKDIVKGFGEFTIGQIETVLGTLWGMLTTAVKWFYNNFIKPVVDWCVEAWNKIADKFNEVKDKIINKWDELKQKIKDKITELKTWLTDKFGSIGTAVGEAVGGAIKRVINGVLSTVENLLNAPIRAINKLIEKVRVLPGLKNLSTLSTFSFPRLAKGGIINMPGRGVPVGSAIGGERGQEGVIPLTDSQQMALLGEAIGKYININATVPVYVGNRLVMREMKRINAEDNFAYNR